MPGTIPLTFTAHKDKDEIHCQRHSNRPVHGPPLVYSRTGLHPVRSQLSPEQLKAWDAAREELGWPIQGE